VRDLFKLTAEASASHLSSYAESTNDVRVVIERQKEIKNWLRAKKVALIESVNLHWLDLGEGWQRGESIPS
jgi:putative endonuclease